MARVRPNEFPEHGSGKRAPVQAEYKREFPTGNFPIEIADRETERSPVMVHGCTHDSRHHLRHLSGYRELQCQNLSGARWIALAPQRARWMQVQTAGPGAEIVVDVLYRESAASPVEDGEIPRMDLVPFAFKATLKDGQPAQHTTFLCRKQVPRMIKGGA